MLKWTIIFFLSAILAAMYGFGGLAEGAEDVAKVMCFIFTGMVFGSLFSNFKRI
ncbi:DUF1328 domain-containing protein [Cyclobacterium amurskyense]|jgi:uncharacterized membrane protein YtjA (UPF0391 family)|uniref:Membrane protein n=1 Tax=Cyclobacterium amurskyense TaxID=320787 RepID=A0A0H4PJ46_9BACT|nr:DUF1328 family protein [Cyclobacterium amurskyense]AKP54149.1 membrane protein [Cyclobacterium amurskyense]|tara:strand:- start:12455 stop:12616 length:162 start_codon:yes stop_codon:yes gene_type:complete